jgi:glycosyltransferase involved in cell wall biosynthesis
LSAAAATTPTLTIVIPYWDLDPQILLDAVASLADQDGTYRTIVVDNASVVPLPPLPSHVEILRLPRRVGVGTARNAGLAVVETSHVLFLDADDQLFPGSIPFLLGQLAADPEAIASLAGGRGWWTDPAAAKLARRGDDGRRVLQRLIRLQRHPRLLAAFNTVSMIVQPVFGILRVDTVRRAGGFSAHEAESDWVLSALLTFQGRVIAGTRSVRRYRFRVDSLSQIKHRDWRISAGARKEMRRRLRRDPAVPLPVRLATPLLVVLHSRPLVREVWRRLRSVGRARRPSEV